MKIHQHYDLITPSSSTKEDLPPLIFMHGTFFNRKTWKKVAPDIAEKTGRKAFLVDARNHGESPRSDRMDYDVLTQDLLDFLNEHSIRKAVIIGHSMGGRTTINFALKHPDRVDMIIVEDMTTRNVKSSTSNITRLLYEGAADTMKGISMDMDLDSAKRLIVESLINAFSLNVDEETLKKYYDPDMFPIKKGKDSFETQANLDALFKMMDGNALVQNLPDKNIHFDGDALFIYGTHGFFDLGKDPTVKKLFPNCVLKKIDGACHFVHISKPDEYKDVVSNFILRRNCATQSKY